MGVAAVFERLGGGGDASMGYSAKKLMDGLRGIFNAQAEGKVPKQDCIP